MDFYYSVLTRLIEKGQYFKFQYVDFENKEKMDLIDEEGLNSDPNFQQYVFSSEEYFQDFTALTNELKKPVLVIAGEYDNAVGPNHHQLFQFRNAEVSLLKSGHHPYIENQLEFKDAVLHFVDNQFRLRRISDK